MTPSSCVTPDKSRYLSEPLFLHLGVRGLLRKVMS